jgi:hypothetical protein
MAYDVKANHVFACADLVSVLEQASQREDVVPFFKNPAKPDQETWLPRGKVTKWPLRSGKQEVQLI